MPNKQFDSEYFIFVWNPKTTRYDVKGKYPTNKDFTASFCPHDEDILIKTESLNISDHAFTDLKNAMKRIQNMYK